MAKKTKNTRPANVTFADQYEGCQVVANIMGLNVETVRKRAKAGKIPGKQNARGTWVFYHTHLVAAGVIPFSSAPVASSSSPQQAPGPLPLPVKKKNVTDVIFVLDRSGSMNGLIDRARANLDAQLDQLRSASGPNDQYDVTVINFDSSIMTTVQGRNVTALHEGAEVLYLPPSGWTRLYDAVAEAVRIANTHDDGQRAFLISVVTDGEENRSRTPLYDVAAMVRAATAKDRFTFVYAGPVGSDKTALRMGFDQGNITTWEQTAGGTMTLGATTSTSLDTYTRARSVGTMRSTSFYAQPVTGNAQAFAADLDNKLDDVSAQVTVHRVTDTDPVVINKFCEKKFGYFEKGKYFYQLTSSEKVQDYKRVVIQDTTTGTFYDGWAAARKLLGIPDFKGTVHIRPGNLGDFKVFIQSTSTNRKLVPGTAVIYLP